MIINICENPGVLHTIYIIKMVLKVLCILVPVIILITSIISVAKTIMNQDDSDIKGVVKLTIVKFVVGAFIFFIPTIVGSIFSIVNDGGVQNKFSSCISNATLSKINYLNDQRKKELENKLNNQNNNSTQNSSNSQNSNNQSNTQSSNNSGTNNQSSSGNNSNTNNYDNSGNISGENSTSSTSKTMFIGDSRTVGMYYATYSDSYQNSIQKSVNNELWYASVGKGYNWFKNSAISYIENNLKNSNYNVVILMGANDLYNNSLASNYISLVKGLSTKYSYSKFIIVSVNPINDQKSLSSGYSVKNSQVISFNASYVTAINGSENVSYCDTYSSIIGSYSTTDGLHYNNSTYQKIYNLIKDCI